MLTTAEPSRLPSVSPSIDTNADPRPWLRWSRPAATVGRCSNARESSSSEPIRSCVTDEFAEWAAAHSSLRMEDFYRWNRRRLGYLMDGDEPATGRWNYDAENRQPPPKSTDQRSMLPRWPDPLVTPLDDLDRQVLTFLTGCGVVGPPACGPRATSRHNDDSTTSSPRCCRRSDHTRTPCSRPTGTSPTR